MVDSLGMEGIIRISRSLPVAFANGSDVRAREDLALGSVFCGLVHDNCKLGTIYGIANALGGYGGARGAICASLFPTIFDATMQKTDRILKELKANPNPSAADTREITYLTRMLHRTAYVAQVLTGNEDATAFDICDYLRDMKETLQIPSLKEIYEFPVSVVTVGHVLSIILCDFCRMMSICAKLRREQPFFPAQRYGAIFIHCCVFC